MATAIVKVEVLEGVKVEVLEGDIKQEPADPISEDPLATEEIIQYEYPKVEYELDIVDNPIIPKEELVSSNQLLSFSTRPVRENG